MKEQIMTQGKVGFHHSAPGVVDCAVIEVGTDLYLSFNALQIEETFTILSFLFRPECQRLERKDASKELWELREAAKQDPDQIAVKLPGQVFVLSIAELKLIWDDLWKLTVRSAAMTSFDGGNTKKTSNRR